MTKHTPGPWYVSPVRLSHGVSGRFLQVRTEDTTRGKSGDPVAFVPYSDTPSKHCEAYANAHVFSASLDLLAAAQRALNFLLNHQSSLGIAPESADELDTTKMLRAAIRKAEGG